MNKTAIKNYAIWARVQLIDAAKQRAYEYEITENGENKTGLDMVGGKLLTKTEKEQRNQLISEINRKGYAQVMEEAAYTWFNRFIALRFMEVNGYLPSKVRVFTDENGAFRPEILKQAISLDIEGLDRSKVLDLLDKQDNEELFKYLLITQCNALNAGLPYMFEKISNWTELLFPANLLRQDSVLGQMISEIPEEDWTDAVQIIGWLYQYYNSELKDETFGLLKKNIKITKERIPAATQLFTPDWIVRYMVENSLGRLWYEGHPDFDKSQWKYYLDEAKQEPEVEAQLQKIRTEYAVIKPEEIKVIDPCMGSGHILVYAFDVLMQIYTSAGWSERDAAKSILENNLYGLDIDDRAGQLAYFAVMMKARKHSRRILNGDVKPNVLSIQDSNWMTDEFIAYVADKNTTMKADLIMLRKTFKDAKEYGSILNVPAMQYDALYERIDIINRSYAEDLFQTQYRIMAIELLLPLVKQSQIMSQQYDVVVTNPPYMANGGFGNKLDSYIKENYIEAKSDLYAVFIRKCSLLAKNKSFIAMITQHSWMFISSYEKLREQVCVLDVINMAHLGARAFDEIAGEVVQTTSFVLRKTNYLKYKGKYQRLVDYNSEQQKEEQFLSHKNEFISEKQNFRLFPGNPYVYWVGENIANCFNNYPMLDKQYTFREGIHTADNNRFLRVWFEVPFNRIVFNASSEQEIDERGRWVPYNKGGKFRKWYGNNDYVIGFDSVYRNQMSQLQGHVRPSQDLYYKSGGTWTAVASGKLGLRFFPDGFLFDAGGQIVVGRNVVDCIALLNTKIYNFFADMLMPTLNYKCGMLKTLPNLIIRDDPSIRILAEENIRISKDDWDSYETSWDFRQHPFVVGNDRLISKAFEKWSKIAEDRFNTVLHNEIIINTTYLNKYNLNHEVISEYEENDITISKASLHRDVISFISYAVGCMFGRYSLDTIGLCYAGGVWDSSKYKSFIPDTDNIIPICDDDYFDDDIVGKFVDFVRKVYGEETLEENLRFVADALGGKGTSRDVIRNYFLNDFFADHCSTYSVTGSGKRPIYWLFSSGKKNGFKALIYMHRYQPDLLARMRTDYVHEQQERYRTQLQMLEISAQSAAPSERVKLNKQITKLKDQALEIQKYEEKIHHLADQMISIDLDDGVKVNYAKFQDVLEKIK